MAFLSAVAFLAFIALGLPDGILGVAWPALHAVLGIPLDALGLLLGAAMAGYILSSMGTGKLLALFGTGGLLAASTLLAGISLAGYALSPNLAVLLLAGFASGLGGGAVDASLNTFAAYRFSPRTLHWLHASYSLGALLGPAALSAVMAVSAAGSAWRLGYALVAAIQIVLALVFLLTRRAWSMNGPGQGAEGGESTSVTHASIHASIHASYGETLRRPGVLQGVLAFFLYAGLEFAVGQWAYTLLTLGRRMETAKAALWVGVFWGSFFGGRVLAGLLPLGGRVRLLLRLGPAGMVAGSMLALLGGNSYATLAGLSLLGFAFAPVFPLMVAATPSRLGRRHAANAMGFQVAAATVGMAAVPGLVGVAAGRLGMEVIPRAWVLVAVLVLWSLFAMSRGQGGASD
jgi:fucose permease